MQNILTIPAQGCTLGLTLWYTSVLPSLLPFFILSGLLIRTGAFRFLNRIFAPVLTRIFPVSSDGSYAILMGYLCGFPMGAKVIAELVAHQHISREEGSYLMVFCNNVSPAFFVNYICQAWIHKGSTNTILRVLWCSAFVWIYLWPLFLQSTGFQPQYFRCCPVYTYRSFSCNTKTGIHSPD